MRALSRVRRAAPLLISCLTGCGADASLAPQVVDPSRTSSLAPLAFTATVDVQRKTITLAGPTRATTAAPTASIGATPSPLLSILGNDAVRLVPANLKLSAPGAFTPNKVRVTFDIAIENRFSTLALTVPTWPQPPVPAVILFPLDVSVTRSPGGVTGTDGNTLTVSAPSNGTVVPSRDWNGTGDANSGAPYDFFTEATCDGGASRNCVRWVAFGPSIAPGSPRVVRTVGYDIDESVQQFRTRMLVVADLVPVTAPVP